jgi:hypothetical protein
MVASGQTRMGNLKASSRYSVSNPPDLYHFDRRAIDARKENVCCMDAYTGCHLFDVAGWETVSLNTSQVRW